LQQAAPSHPPRSINTGDRPRSAVGAPSRGQGEERLPGLDEGPSRVVYIKEQANHARDSASAAAMGSLVAEGSPASGPETARAQETELGAARTPHMPRVWLDGNSDNIAGHPSHFDFDARQLLADQLDGVNFDFDAGQLDAREYVVSF